MTRIVSFSMIVAITVIGVVLINANTASTTALCEDEPKGGLCKTEAHIFAFLQGTTFETPVGSVQCLTTVESYMEPATPAGEPLEGGLYFEFESCAIPGVGICEVTETAEPTASLTWTSGSNGTMQLGKGAEAPEVQIVCNKINCTYRLEGNLEVKGGSKATIVASKENMERVGGSICPGSGAAISFSASYNVGSLYVGQTIPPVSLCRKSETPCPEGEDYGVPTSFVASLESSTSAKLGIKITEESEATQYTVSCSSSKLEGKTTASGWPTKVELSTVTFGECGGTCAVKAIKPPFSGSIEATGGGNGELTWPFRLRVRCIGAYKCTYEASSVKGTITGGISAKMPVAISLNKLITGESDTKCGAEVTWEGAYRFSKPEAGGEPKMWIVREGI